jgi:pimeloyl-ACP methyl ester carboxylesterase
VCRSSTCIAGSLVCLLAVFGQTAVASATVVKGHPISQALKRPVANNSRIVTAAGVKQRIDCRGSGPVTLVVVTGLGSPSSSWSLVGDGFRAVTRTCFYDRPGLGASPKRPNKAQVVDAGLYARELAALLKAASEPGPYVVLGHSFGGLVARAFIRSNLSSIRGVILAESVDPADKSTGRYWREAGHSVDMRLSQAATGGGPKLGHLPLLVLSASNPEGDHLGGQTYGQSPAMIDQWIAQQSANIRLSSNSMQVVATSGHVLQQDAPATVVEAVRVIVNSVTHGEPLDCTTLWTSPDATCE